MGGRCRKVGELAARHWRSLCVFGAFLVLDASFAEDLRFRGPSTPLWLQKCGGLERWMAIEMDAGDKDDRTWRTGIRAGAGSGRLLGAC